MILGGGREWRLTAWGARRAPLAWPTQGAPPQPNKRRHTMAESDRPPAGAAHRNGHSAGKRRGVRSAAGASRDCKIPAGLVGDACRHDGQRTSARRGGGPASLSTERSLAAEMGRGNVERGSPLAPPPSACRPSGEAHPSREAGVLATRGVSPRLLARGQESAAVGASQPVERAARRRRWGGNVDQNAPDARRRASAGRAAEERRPVTRGGGAGDPRRP